jgi:hypothetical protein
MRDDDQLLHDARCAVLRSMHRLGGVATTAALASTTGFNGRLLTDTVSTCSIGELLVLARKNWRR